MKTILFSALFFLSSILIAAELSLCDIPYSNASYFWTQDGPRLPVMDKNLNGNPLKVAGQSYSRGIAGHTGFSAVWNLGGKAEAFSCELGIEDEDHPKDSSSADLNSDVNFVLLGDRKELLKLKVRLGEKAVPVTVSLKNIEQFELRGEYGKGFLRQRPVFLNPLIKTGSSLEELSEYNLKWRKKFEDELSFTASYPNAPAWKNIKVTKENYCGFQNAYKFDTGVSELIITPEFGGMILSYSLKGQKNIISSNGNNPVARPLERGKTGDCGGHFNRTQPRNYFVPAEPVLINGNYGIEFPAEGEIKLSSAPGSYLFIRQYYLIKLKADSADLEIVNTQQNTAPFSQDCGIWSITRLDTSIIKAFKMSLHNSSLSSKDFIKPDNLRSRLISLNGYDELSISQDFLNSLDRHGVEWQRWPLKGEITVKMQDSVFSKSFEIFESESAGYREYPPAHIYLDKRFTEIEAHGPIRMLAPGESVSLKENWSLRELKE